MSDSLTSQTLKSNIANWYKPDGCVSILFRVNYVGQGVVVFDSNEQRFNWNEMAGGRGYENVYNKNVSFGKHVWSLTNLEPKDGKPIYDKKLSVSSDALRHYVFINDFPFHTPNVFVDRQLLNEQNGSMAAILRGYMFAKMNLKRKSPICMTDAIQSNNAISTLSTFSSSAKKDNIAKREGRERDENDTSDNTFFKRETVGKITYQSSGGLDLKELQFVSMDDMHDRQALNPDDFETLYRPALEKDFESKMSDADIGAGLHKIADPGYFAFKNSTVKLPEYGFVMNDRQILQLVREFFTRLLSLQIRKGHSGYMEVQSVQIKYVTDPIRDRMESEEGWITINHPDEINFSTKGFYEVYEKAEAEKKRNAYLNALTEYRTAEREKNIEDNQKKMERAKSHGRRPKGKRK